MKRIALVFLFFLFFGGTTPKSQIKPVFIKVDPEVKLTSSIDNLAVGIEAVKKSIKQSKK